MKLIPFLAGCLIAAPLCAYEQAGNLIKLDAAEVSKCKADGGCVVVTQIEITRSLEQVAEMALKVGYASGKASCRNST